MLACTILALAALGRKSENKGSLRKRIDHMNVRKD